MERRQAIGRTIGPKEFPWMRLEGHRQPWELVGASDLTRFADDRQVTTMHAVKISDRDGGSPQLFWAVRVIVFPSAKIIG